MTDVILRAYVWPRAGLTYLAGRIVKDDQGEGVISAAIAVLIMAFLGVAMWIAFKATLGGATRNVDNQVNQIGH